MSFDNVEGIDFGIVTHPGDKTVQELELATPTLPGENLSAVLSPLEPAVSFKILAKTDSKEVSEGYNLHCYVWVNDGYETRRRVDAKGMPNNVDSPVIGASHSMYPWETGVLSDSDIRTLLGKKVAMVDLLVRRGAVCGKSNFHIEGPPPGRPNAPERLAKNAPKPGKGKRAACNEEPGAAKKGKDNNVRVYFKDRKDNPWLRKVWILVDDDAEEPSERQVSEAKKLYEDWLEGQSSSQTIQKKRKATASAPGKSVRENKKPKVKN